ncbi:hypothetical protein HDK77DRAFT_480216 [Phyllosticta capitalensis]
MSLPQRDIASCFKIFDKCPFPTIKQTVRAIIARVEELEAQNEQPRAQVTSGPTSSAESHDDCTEANALSSPNAFTKSGKAEVLREADEPETLTRPEEAKARDKNPDVFDDCSEGKPQKLAAQVVERNPKDTDDVESMSVAKVFLVNFMNEMEARGNIPPFFDGTDKIMDMEQMSMDEAIEKVSLGLFTTRCRQGSRKASMNAMTAGHGQGDVGGLLGRGALSKRMMDMSLEQDQQKPAKL